MGDRAGERLERQDFELRFPLARSGGGDQPRHHRVASGQIAFAPAQVGVNYFWHWGQ